VITTKPPDTSANARELLERQACGKTVTLREVLQLAARRLSPGDSYVGDAATEITVLRQVAEKVPIADVYGDTEGYRGS
jgi:hypothetical protein